MKTAYAFVLVTVFISWVAVRLFNPDLARSILDYLLYSESITLNLTLFIVSAIGSIAVFKSSREPAPERGAYGNYSHYVGSWSTYAFTVYFGCRACVIITNT